ncbi:cobalamin-binding protein [Deinococcus metallilatus]|uniref:Cobalamin-binding protein n=1 Tax=Deinococcus metallilatus TaxID=1211322 RepID=A0AAJ5JXV8_9DEIO|nr:helical backbone metal receptor [Deinococcus metallilatus]MBB5296652.1 iron complex transport system substrate-binding protein [Deinococcus metallilatus]QBY09260.1 cobalamin-binding protein [Deinococcus metallilatus]RXJ09781.1 cobalamin-binding protein [Deinococcus metallilatus]TLK24246.1 cobalamin-binding protein [Deinococcus metallilatus]GMA13682.1 cobalamin-binding protein [Deinococcus metallilatus]
MRLASLTSSNSDILAALGAAPWVVAVDNHSDAPGLDGAVRVGPDLNIDVQAVRVARPDLVLASLSVPGMERVVEGVRAAGLRTLVLDPVSVPDTLRDIREIGAATGLSERAEALAADLDAELRGLARVYPRPPRVLVEWWPRPIIAATRESWVTDLLATLGAVNALGERPGRSTPLTLEEVRAARPDLIVCSWCGARKLRPEVIEARGLGVPVVCVPESGLGRPGPRLIEGARQIAAALADLRLV